MGYLTTDKKKITVKTLLQMKAEGEKIAQLTAYDFTTAAIFDEAGIDSIHVGDSGSNVVAGNDDTLPITVDEMIFMARGVARACKHCFVVCDMPFGSYQISKEDAVRNAVKIMKETGVDALKLEGGIEILDTVKAIIAPRRAYISSVAMVFAPRTRPRPTSCSLTLLPWMRLDASALRWRRYRHSLPRRLLRVFME